MSHRSKLLLVTCAVCLSFAPVLTATAATRAATTAATTAKTGSGTPHSTAAANPKPAIPSPASASPASSPKAAVSQTFSTWKHWAWWVAIAIVPVLVVGGVLYQLGKNHSPRREKLSAQKTARSLRSSRLPGENSSTISSVSAPEQRSDQPSEVTENAAFDSEELVIEQTDAKQAAAKQAAAKQAAMLKQEDAFSATTRLSRVDRVEALIEMLHSSDPGQRRKSIWELGQRGDSRAIQPLVDLLVDSDSQQRSLILSVISEISLRTLKPMNRALLLSIQDDSADVRKNAIRDVTRFYDLVTQISQLLQYATGDSDGEVRETAQWALAQLNRIRPVPGTEGLPGLSNGNANALEPSLELAPEESSKSPPNFQEWQDSR